VNVSGPAGGAAAQVRQGLDYIKTTYGDGNVRGHMTTASPSIGRIVHYVSFGTPPRADGSQAYESECRAAVVAGIIDAGPGPPDSPPSSLVALVVFNPTGLFFNEASQDEDGHRGGPWHETSGCQGRGAP
jgi:hypothetical protein